MIERWSRDQVLGLAPDGPSGKAAQGVAAPGRWQARGVTEEVLWGECAGSGAKPYLACVDLGGPAYRCSCPSRKFPCKHALGLLLLWSADDVPDEDVLPSWAAEWITRRAARAEAAQGEREALPRAEGARDDAGSCGSAPTGVAAVGIGDGQAGRRARVAAGLAELERWLADQVRQGLPGAEERDWEELGRRLVDAQAPGVAAAVRRLGRVRAGGEWGRLLGEYALINLLAVGFRRRDELPAELARTVMMRVGFPVTRGEVLSGPVVRDLWDVLGRRDEEQDRLVSRRVWLRGRRTGRAALVLSFAPVGQALDASLVTGTAVNADLAFYPGATPLRALVATRHPQPGTGHGTPPGVPVEEALAEVASAVAGDPWTDSWPVVLAGVVPAVDRLGGLPWHPRVATPWRLLAVSGGHPVTVAAEWTPRGLIPLTTWYDDGQAVLL
ncbi:SWIM zinc finger family protein [Nonomuraea sp. NPDC046570]|uniref:SWIM zinc finger family protein n=1 Tax=Nonomuraea sp. NPDC046570 TaxID=3155255 RepID=UPI00340E0CFD